MDGHSFDRWTKLLVTGYSRRGALQVLTAGTLAGGIFSRGWLDAEALCRGTGAACKRVDQCCSGICKRGVCRCGRLHAACLRNKDCCASASGLERCADNSCFPEGKTCCRRVRQVCVDSCDCCGILRCDDNNVDTGIHCCNLSGSPCTEKRDCCGTRACVGGTCQVL